jgi:hypothetical protein
MRTFVPVMAVVVLVSVISVIGSAPAQASEVIALKQVIEDMKQEIAGLRQEIQALKSPGQASSNGGGAARTATGRREQPQYHWETSGSVPYVTHWKMRGLPAGEYPTDFTN